MGRATRSTATVVVAASLLALTSPGSTAVPASGAATQPSGQSAFIDALAALPGAIKDISRARDALETAKEQQALAGSVADARRRDYAATSDVLHERILVRTRAELAAARAQDSVDDVARQLYSAGGSVPSLVDVMLTADSEDGLMRSLVTRQYLSAAADNRVDTGTWAQDQATQADYARTAAELNWMTASEQWQGAAADLELAAKANDAAVGDLSRASKKYRQLLKVTSVDRSADYGRVKQCGDWLTKLLARTGFSGENLREAWAIVMRESGGREDAISVSNDLGLFQINTATWQKQPWFNRKALLKRKFNAKVGYLLSKGGDSWYSWGLDGHGRPDAGAYVNAGWSEKRIVAKIIEPYVLWYSLYPCRPAYEKNAWMDLPIDIATATKPRADDNGEEPLTAGGGQTLPGRPMTWPTAIPTSPPLGATSTPEPVTASPSETSAPAADPESPTPTPLVTDSPSPAT